jgi:hypothetical protein
VATQFKQITQDLQLRDVQVRRSLNPFPLCERWRVCARVCVYGTVRVRADVHACVWTSV